MKTIVQRVLSVFVMLMTMSVFVHAQEWEQIYPSWEVNGLHDMLHWNGDTIFVGGNNWTLLRSIDAGETWEDMLSEDSLVTIEHLYKQGNVLYFSGHKQFRPIETMLFTYNVSNGTVNRVPYELYKSTNTRTYNFEITSTMIFSTEYGNPAGTVADDGRSNYFRRSSNDGVTWETQSLPGDYFYSFHLVTDSIAFINIRDSISKLYWTSNAGDTWEVRTNSIANYYYSYADANGITCYSYTPTKTFQVSVDTGRTWSALSDITNYTDDIYAIEIANHNVLYVLGDFGSVFKTNDGGNSWAMIYGSNTHEGIASDLISPSPGTVISINNRGRIYRSTNDGATWNRIRSTDVGSMKDVHFFDNTHGICFYYDIQKHYRLSSTTNGGSSWSSLAINDKHPIQYVAFDEIYAYTTSRIASGNLFTYWKTTDQGQSWEYMHEGLLPIPSTLTPSKFTGSGNLYSYLMPMNNNNFSYTQLYTTTDAGETWHTVNNTDSTFYFDDIIYSKSSSGNVTSYCVSQYTHPSQYRPTLWVSYDSCLTWSVLYAPWNTDITRFDTFCAISADTLLLTGRTPSGSVLLMSYDAGNTWVTVTQDTTESFLWCPDTYFSSAGYFVFMGPSVYKTTDYWNSYTVQLYHQGTSDPKYHFINSETGWIATDEGAVYHNASSNSITAVEDISVVMNNPELSSAYPNPVTVGQRISIQYTTSVSAPVQIAVMDILGRQIADLSQDQSSIGTNTVQWRAPTSLPAGLYFIRMTAGNTQSVKQISIAK